MCCGVYVFVFSVFVSAQSWPSLLLLLEESPKAVIGLGSRLCQPLSMIVTHYPALSDRVMAILEMMSDECLYGITSEVSQSYYPYCPYSVYYHLDPGMECSSNTGCIGWYSRKNIQVLQSLITQEYMS